MSQMIFFFKIGAKPYRWERWNTDNYLLHYFKKNPSLLHFYKEINFKFSNFISATVVY